MGKFAQGRITVFERSDVAPTGLVSLALILLHICHAYGVGAVGLNNRSRPSANPVRGDISVENRANFTPKPRRGGIFRLRCKMMPLHTELGNYCVTVSTNMSRLTALKMNPNGIQIHQPRVAPKEFGATLGNRPHKFLNAEGVASNPPPHRCNSFRVVRHSIPHPA